jgi:hypothetical protein
MRLFACALAVPTPYGERQRPQARLGNLQIARETPSVAALIQPNQGLVDSHYCLHLHPEQRERQVALGIGVATVELVADVSPSGRAFLAKTASDVGLCLSPKRTEHVSQAGLANGFARHVYLLSLAACHTTAALSVRY